MQYLRAYARDIEGDDTPETPITWIASTEGVKADGLDLRSDAWDLSRYEQFGPVLWAHDMWGERLPIGKGVAFLEDSKLMVRVAYDTGDPFAMQVRAKARQGMVAGSVSWDTIKEGEDMRNQLLEFSMVPVPMDPASLPVRQRAAMRDLAQRLLDATDEPDTDEDGWHEVASQMVRLVREVADDSERLSEYRRLERQYRKLSKEPPEFMTCSQLAGLTVHELRGLFLEGEADMYPEQFTEPLRLTRRQMDKVQQALDLLQQALAGAEVTEDAEPELPEGMDTLIALNDLLDQQNITATGEN